MKTRYRISMGLIAAAAVMMLCGCASDNGVYEDEEEFSSMPWNTPQNWEAGPDIPGMSPTYR